MKLDKKGWDLGRETFYIIIFAVCLIIAIIGIIRMNLLLDDGPDINIGTDSFDYSILENKLVTHSKDYINNKEKINSTEIITDDVLLENEYMSEFVDGTGEKCDGYVIFDSTTDTYTPYISCFNYATAGYDKTKAKK